MRTRKRSSALVNGSLLVICILWLIPTVGLLVSSFRTRDDVLSTGWWTILPHQEWSMVQQFAPPPSIDTTVNMQIAGASETLTNSGLG